MKLEDKISAFSRLATALLTTSISESNEEKDFFLKVFYHNGWFAEENVRLALNSIALSLVKSNTEKWTSAYPVLEFERKATKSIGVIMAGNIPAVGFHDFLCVLMSGHKFVGKLSSDDNLLMREIAKTLIEIEPRFEKQIEFTSDKLKKIDAVIATGSNNSSRYFDYYFSKYPHIIRKNRHSVAVLDGTETKEDLQNLGKDIFQYFGLGCRNVSKLFVPKGYDFQEFFESIYDFKSVLSNNKYANNYEYNRTIYLMSQTKLLDNNFLLLKEDIGMSSPVGVLYYEFYDNEKELKSRLLMDKESIQCVVSSFLKDAIPFGETQCPQLGDYADGVDTMKFLLEL